MFLNSVIRFEVFLAFILFSKSLYANELDNKIKDFILKNPKIIIESLNNFEKQKENEKKANKKKLIKENYSAIFDTSTLLYEGDKQSKNIIVEFFDYNCSYCKKAHQDLKKTLNETKDVKIIYKNFPILSENSLKLSKYAIIISEIDQQKFSDFHNYIMNFKGQPKDNDIIELIKKLDLNINLIESRINEKNIKKKLNKDIELANKLGLRGTPAFVIKDELIFGYIEYEEILSRLYN